MSGRVRAVIISCALIAAACALLGWFISDGDSVSVVLGCVALTSGVVSLAIATRGGVAGDGDGTGGRGQ